MLKADILLIGATGTIGRHLLVELQKRSASFKALVRSTEKAVDMEKKGYRIAMGDLADPASLRRAMEGVQKVFLLSNPSEQQVKLQSNAVQAAQMAGVRHIVKVSAIGTSLESPLQLARMHAATENEIMNSRMVWTFLHPHSVMQNWLSLVNQVREMGVFFSFTKEGKYAPVDARDVAAVAARVLTEPGHEFKTYELTGPESVSMKDVADALELALDRNIKIKAIAPENSYEALLHTGMPNWLARDLSMQNQSFAQGKGNDTSPDVELITGSRPISVKQFALDHAPVFR